MAAGDPMVRECDDEMTLDLSVRVIPFAIRENRLVVGLRRDERPALPHGSLRPGETLAGCAARIARESLSRDPDYLEQLYTFSIVGPPARVIVAYFALLSADTLGRMSRQSTLAFDPVVTPDAIGHEDARIIDYARTRLRAKLGYSNVGFHFLPREFTLSELQDVYETVIGQPLDKRNFRRRILAAGIVESLDAKRSTSHRPATLYRFSGGDPASGTLTPDESDWSS